MRDFIKRVAVGVAIGLSLFFLKSHVFAATISLSNNRYMVSTHDCLIGEVGCTNYQTYSYQTNGTWTSLGSYTIDTLHRIYLVGVYAQSTPSSSLTAGNTYTYTFRTQLDPKENALKHVNALQYNIYGLNGSNWSDTYIASQSCSTRNVVTHDYAIETTCTFTVNTTITGVLVRSIYSTTLIPTRITCSNTQMQSAQNEIGILTEINSTIKSITAQIINSINISNQEMIDLDADASQTYNNDYSTSAYDNAESSIDSAMDVDVSSLVFDITSWHNPFALIWDWLDRAVHLNMKVFAMITAFLTFSFVGLVFNR